MGERRIRAPLAPPRLSVLRYVDADAQAVDTSSPIVRPDAEDRRLEGGDVGGVDELVIHRRHGVLPDEDLAGHVRAEVAVDGAHVAVEQLEPGPSESVGELVGVLRGIAREISRYTGSTFIAMSAVVIIGRDLLRRVVRDRHHVLFRAVDRAPLPGAARALDALPLVLEEQIEVAVVPPCRVGRPRALDAGGDRVVAHAGAEVAGPAEALLGRGRQPRARRRRGRRRVAAPCALPNVWPPAMSATVSSSFIAIRAKVSRMSRPDAIGSGLPFGPSGLT